MHAYDTLRQLTHERTAERLHEAQRERQARTARPETRTRRQLTTTAARLQTLLPRRRTARARAAA